MNFDQDAITKLSQLTPRFAQLVMSHARAREIPLKLAIFGIVSTLSIATNLRKARVSADGRRWQPPIVMPMAVGASSDGKSPAVWTALEPLLAQHASALRTFSAKLQEYRNASSLWKRQLKALQRDVEDPRRKPARKAAKKKGSATAPQSDAAAAESAVREDEADIAAAALKKHLENEPQPPVSNRIIFRDDSYLAMVDHAAAGGLIALILDDAHAIRKSGVFDGRLADWYSALPISADTRTHGSVQVLEPRLTASVMIQPAILRGYLRANNSALRFSGIPCRFLVFNADADYGYTDSSCASEADFAVVDGFSAWFTQRLDVYERYRGLNDAVDMRLTTEAAFVLNAWKVRCKQDSLIGGWLSDIPDAARKSTDHVLRLAACIEDFETGNTTIGVAAVLAAQEIVRSCLADFDAVMGCSETATILYHRAPRLLRWLMPKLPVGAAVPEKLLRAACFHEVCPADYWEACLLALEGQGYLLRRKGYIALNWNLSPPSIEGKTGSPPSNGS